MSRGALLFSPGPFGGAEKLILDSILGLQLEVLIIQEARNPEPSSFFIKELEKKSIKYRLFNSTKRYDQELIHQLNQHIHKENLQFVHSHGLKANFINSFLKTRRIATQHGQTSHSLKMKLMEVIENYRLKKMHKLILVSEAMYKATKHPNKILIENFIPTSSGKLLDYNRETPFKIIYAGRLSPEKGIEFLLENIAIPKNVELHLYGEGVLSDYVKSKTCSNIIFHGFSSNIQDKLVDKQLLIIPSQTEGLPMIALEAISLGLPILATKVGGLPKLLEEEIFLMNYNNAKELNDKIKYIIDNYHDVQSKTHKISSIVNQKYSKEKWLSSVKSLYESVSKSF